MPSKPSGRIRQGGLRTRVWRRRRRRRTEDGDPQVTATLRRAHADGLLDPNVDPGAAEDDRQSRYEAETGFGSALFDARNGFNELNCYLMLWNVAHL
jgi:hypothetical protein